MDFQLLLLKFAFRSVSAGMSYIWFPLVKPVSDSVKQRLFLMGEFFLTRGNIWSSSDLTNGYLGLSKTFGLELSGYKPVFKSPLLGSAFLNSYFLFLRLLCSSTVTKQERTQSLS